jgi:hypothetical protein
MKVGGSELLSSIREIREIRGQIPFFRGNDRF